MAAASSCVEAWFYLRCIYAIVAEWRGWGRNKDIFLCHFVVFIYEILCVGIMVPQ